MSSYNSEEDVFPLQHPLKRWMLENKISHAGFARELGVSRQYLRMVMMYKNDPTLSLALNIVSLTGGAIKLTDLATDLHYDSKIDILKMVDDSELI